MLTGVLRKSILIILPIIIGWQCDKRPEYPNSPQIEFVEANKVTITSFLDSISIKIKFKDGDGDMGLSSSDPPLREFTYNLDPYGDTVFSNLPFTNCETQLQKGGKIYSITQQQNYFNLFVELYIKNSNNTVTKYQLPYCNKYHKRFSRFDPDNTYKGPLDGDILFYIKDAFKATTLLNKIIYFEIQVQDRAFHKSNIVRTNDFLIK